MNKITRWFGIGALSLASLIGCDNGDNYSVKGELLRDDVIQNSESFGPTYRVLVGYRDSEGANQKFACSVIGNLYELEKLSKGFVSREENGVKGDSLEINPPSNIYGLDEVTITLDDIRKIPISNEINKKKFEFNIARR